MSTAHIVALPGFVTIIRAVQLVLDIIILGLVGNTINGFNQANKDYYGYSSSYFYDAVGLAPLAFMVFCCVWTLLINSYLLITPIFLPVAYNMWAHLSLEVTAWVFWLSGFAATASWASDHDSLGKATGKVYSYWATAAAGAGMGAIMWIMYTVTLVTFSIRLHNHRTDPNNAHLNSYGLAEKGGENHPMGAVQQQPVQPQPAMYPPESAPTPVTYVATPPPQQWQQSPPPQQAQY